MLPMHSAYPITMGLTMNRPATLYQSNYPTFSVPLAPMPSVMARAPGPTQYTSWMAPSTRLSRARYTYHTPMTGSSIKVEEVPIHTRPKKKHVVQEKQQRRVSPAGEAAETDLYSDPEYSEAANQDKNRLSDDSLANSVDIGSDHRSESSKVSDDKSRTEHKNKFGKTFEKSRKTFNHAETNDVVTNFQNKGQYRSTAHPSGYPTQPPTKNRSSFKPYQPYRSQPNINIPNAGYPGYGRNNLRGWPSSPAMNNPTVTEIQRLRNHIHTLESRLQKLQKKLNKRINRTNENIDEHEKKRTTRQTPVIVELNPPAEDSDQPKPTTNQSTKIETTVNSDKVDSSRSDQPSKYSPTSKDRKTFKAKILGETNDLPYKNPNQNHSNNNDVSAENPPVESVEKILDAFERFYVRRAGSTTPMKVKFIPEKNTKFWRDQRPPTYQPTFFGRKLVKKLSTNASVY